MWKNLNKIILPITKLETTFLNAESVRHEQIRTTFILKRKYPAPLHKNGYEPKKLKRKYFIYDLVQDVGILKQPDMQVILTSYVDGIGNIGDKVYLRPNFAYNNLLLPGLAVYASPENLEKYKHFEVKKENVNHSSPTAQRTVNCLSRAIISVVMNKEKSWTLQPWHIKTSFRKCGYEVPEKAITLPPKAINGPDMSIEGKEFYVTVIINNLEKANVRCCIHHWSTEITERIPYEFEFWKKPIEPIFPEDATNLDALNRTKTEFTSENYK